MLFSSAKTTSHLLNTGATSNLYLTDLLRNYPLLTITYKIILRSLRLLSWFLLQSRIWVYFYITDSWSVYPGFILEGDQIVSKTYMPRVEGEDTRLRHYLTRLHRKTFCYSKSFWNAETFSLIATTLPSILGRTSSAVIHPFIQQRQNSFMD